MKGCNRTTLRAANDTLILYSLEKIRAACYMKRQLPKHQRVYGFTVVHDFITATKCTLLCRLVPNVRVQEYAK